MLLLGDIGNTETKICLVSLNKKIIKKITFSSKNTTNEKLKKNFKKLKLKNLSLEKCLFCSVVPKTFKIIKKHITKYFKVKCFELKDLKINKLIKIKVNKNVYHGGIISPGIRLSLNTLITNASLIPNLNLKKIDKVIGSDTVNAVRSGFFWGYRGLIDNIVNLIKKETRKSFKIIITGGFSHLFNKFNNTKVTINRDITIKGLIKACNLIK